MIYHEKGKVIYKGEVISGRTNDYDWANQKIAIEVTETGADGREYTHTLCATAKKDKIQDVKNVKIGEMVDLGFAINAKKYTRKDNNKEDYFTDIEVYTLASALPARSLKAEKPAPKVDDNSLEPQPYDLPF